MWAKTALFLAIFIANIANGQSFILEPFVGVQHVYPGKEVKSRPGSGLTGGLNFVWQPIRIGIEASESIAYRLVEGSPKAYLQSGVGLSWQFLKQDESLFLQGGVANAKDFNTLYIGLRWRHPYFSAGIKLETDLDDLGGRQNALSMTLGIPIFFNY